MNIRTWGLDYYVLIIAAIIFIISFKPIRSFCLGVLRTTIAKVILFIGVIALLIYFFSQTEFFLSTI